MSDHDLLLQTVEAIYASGVDSDRMPVALEETTRLFHAAGTVFFEVADVGQMPTEFWSFGMPALERAPYVEQFMSLNPRLRFAFSQSTGQLVWDYQLIDEDRMERHPFYTDFLTALGLRYSLAVVIERTPDKLIAVSIQRTREQGHVDEREMALMRCLFPHFQRARDLATRLKTAGIRQGALENTLDWLNEGIALLRSDGRVIFANEALCSLARRGDGFCIADGAVEFFSPEARYHFAAAFNSMERIYHDSFSPSSTDFPAPRSDGAPAYTVSIRPLVRAPVSLPRHPNAIAIMLVHDPLTRNIAAVQVLQQLFNLTRAEAHLAQALCAGMTSGTYASTRRISLNTVYTHLRRIREKTACNSIAELIRKFGDLNVPLRLGRAKLDPQLDSRVLTHPPSEDAPMSQFNLLRSG